MKLALSFRDFLKETDSSIIKQNPLIAIVDNINGMLSQWTKKTCVTRFISYDLFNKSLFPKNKIIANHDFVERYVVLPFKQIIKKYNYKVEDFSYFCYSIIELPNSSTSENKEERIMFVFPLIEKDMKHESLNFENFDDDYPIVAYYLTKPKLRNNELGKYDKIILIGHEYLKIIIEQLKISYSDMNNVLSNFKNNKGEKIQLTILK